VITKVCNNRNFEFSHLENNSYRFHFDLGACNLLGKDHHFNGKLKFNENLTTGSGWLGFNYLYHFKEKDTLEQTYRLEKKPDGENLISKKFHAVHGKTSLTSFMKLSLCSWNLKRYNFLINHAVNDDLDVFI